METALVDRITVLAASQRGLVSSDQRARLHGFDRCRPDVVELSMPRIGRGREAPFKVHTSGHLARLDVVSAASPEFGGGGASGVGW